MKKLEVTVEITNMDEFKKRLNNLKEKINDFSEAIESINDFEFRYSISNQHQPDSSNEDKY